MQKGFMLIAGLLAFASASAEEQTHRDAARDLLQAMDAEQTVEQSYNQVLPQLEAMGAQMGISGEERVIFDRYLERMITALREELSWEKLEPGMIETYASVYSEEELRELAGFYNSPLGQKFVRKMPELMTATMQMTQEMMLDFVPRMQEIEAELQAELKAARTRQALMGGPR